MPSSSNTTIKVKFLFDTELLLRPPEKIPKNLPLPPAPNQATSEASASRDILSYVQVSPPTFLLVTKLGDPNSATT